ncbi:ribosome silencing factor [bacterium]|jgi:ribosome-associated protein|nr:ribosome silencing factor [bacterium]
MTTENTQAGTTSVTEVLDSSKVKALACAKAAIEKKGENTKILDLSGISGFTDYFVICSGMSDRQVRAMADAIEADLKKQKHELLSLEGHTDGRWILMDFGDVVVHIFLDALREYYDLETLWADAPKVRIPSEFYGPVASRLN